MDRHAGRERLGELVAADRPWLAGRVEGEGQGEDAEGSEGYRGATGDPGPGAASRHDQWARHAAEQLSLIHI